MFVCAANNVVLLLMLIFLHTANDREVDFLFGNQNTVLNWMDTCTLESNQPINTADSVIFHVTAPMDSRGKLRNCTKVRNTYLDGKCSFEEDRRLCETKVPLRRSCTYPMYRANSKQFDDRDLVILVWSPC